MCIQPHKQLLGQIKHRINQFKYQSNKYQKNKYAFFQGALTFSSNSNSGCATTI